MLIDIHNHTLFGVDDGPETIKESVAMLQGAAKQGIEAIICTPHFRQGMFGYEVDTVLAHYEELVPLASKEGIQLYLGCEYHVDGDMVEHLRSGRCKSLGGSDYVLAEYSHSTEAAYVRDSVHKLLANGYVPIIAHVERYACFTSTALSEEVRAMGAMLQCNADSILGIDGRVLEKNCKKLLKHGLVDIVASDAHGIQERKNHMSRCRQFVEKKYGQEYAEILFSVNPGKILSDITGESEA